MITTILFATFFIFVKSDSYHPEKIYSSVKNEEEIVPSFWKNNAKATIEQKLRLTQNVNQAKNVIFFIGDGLDLATVSATRMYQESEETYLSFENFPHFGLATPYCIDRKVADSACTSTAYLTGVKGNYGTIKLNAQAERYKCDQPESFETESILQWAQKAGKATGFVTTTKVTHASPTGLYASVGDRYWESDADLIESGCDPMQVQDIASQLINRETGQRINVIMGGGRKMFLNQTQIDEEGFPGRRLDGKNYIQEWQNLKLSRNDKYAYVWNKTTLNNLDFQNTDYLLGLFESDHCHYNLDIKNQALPEEPTLTEMVRAAILTLKNNENGFFLFVEGGRIDTAHHDSFIQIALEETAEMARAVHEARSLTDQSNTLIVVSADHGHTLMYNGYQARGANILGATEISKEDNLPYPALSYANGPGYYNTYKEDGGRLDFSEFDTMDPELRYPGTVPLTVESHGGGNVGVWATGPFSHLFVGTYEQTALPVLMAFAAKIGPFSSSSVVFGVSKGLVGLLVSFWIKKFIL